MAAYLTSDLSHQCLRVMFKFHEVCIGCYGDESLTSQAVGCDPRSTNDDLTGLQDLSSAYGSVSEGHGGHTHTPSQYDGFSQVRAISHELCL